MSLAVSTSEHRNDYAARLTLVRSPGSGPVSRCVALLLTVSVRPVITAFGPTRHADGRHLHGSNDAGIVLQIGATASNVWRLGVS